MKPSGCIHTWNLKLLVSTRISCGMEKKIYHLNVNENLLCKPSKIYLFKVNDRNTRKGVKYVQS